MEKVFTIDELAPARGDRRGDRGHERRPAARRPLPGRLGADAVARHVHPLQLGAVRRRHPLLRPRAARGDPASRLGEGAARAHGRARLALCQPAKKFSTRSGSSRTRSSAWTRRARPSVRRRGRGGEGQGHLQPDLARLPGRADHRAADPGGRGVAARCRRGRDRAHLGPAVDARAHVRGREVHPRLRLAESRR